MKIAIILIFQLLLILAACNGGTAPDKNKSISVASPADSSVKKAEMKSGPDNYLIDDMENQDNGPVYMYCEKMPEFKGGEAAFQNFVRSNVRYPAKAVTEKAEGRVVVKFIVRETGKPTDVRVLHRVRPDLDQECLRVLGNMPDWIPGTIGGKPVAVSFSIPVRFVLNDNGNLSGFYILPKK